MKLAFIIVSMICFGLSALPPAKEHAGSLMAIGLAFFAAAHLY
jgi:hypothetical protein